MNKLYEGETAWAHVTGSGWESHPWWRSVEYVNGDSDKIGVVRVVVADPDTADEDDFTVGPFLTFEVNPVVLQAAIVRRLGHPYSEEFADAITELDAVDGDAILQTACFGEVAFG